MARSADVFTAAQAAQVLGISERRVRQMVTEGRLPGERGSDNIVRIPQQAVNDERKRRKGSDRATKAGASGSGRAARPRKAAAPEMDVDTLAEKVATAVGQRISGQLEITQQAESLLRSELDEERARRMQVEAQLSEARNEAISLRGQVESLQSQLQQAQQRKGIFRRG